MSFEEEMADIGRRIDADLAAKDAEIARLRTTFNRIRAACDGVEETTDSFGDNPEARSLADRTRSVRDRVDEQEAHLDNGEPVDAAELVDASDELRDIVSSVRDLPQRVGAVETVLELNPETGEFEWVRRTNAAINNIGQVLEMRGNGSDRLDRIEQQAAEAHAMATATAEAVASIDGGTDRFNVKKFAITALAVMGIFWLLGLLHLFPFGPVAGLGIGAVVGSVIGFIVASSSGTSTTVRDRIAARGANRSDNDNDDDPQPPAEVTHPRPNNPTPTRTARANANASASV